MYPAELLRTVSPHLPHVSPELLPGVPWLPAELLSYCHGEFTANSPGHVTFVTYTWHECDRVSHLAAARTSNLSLNSWKVTRTGRQPWKSGPEGALLTPRIVTCLWMFNSSWNWLTIQIKPIIYCTFTFNDFPNPSIKLFLAFSWFWWKTIEYQVISPEGRCKNWLKLKTYNHCRCAC